MTLEKKGTSSSGFGGEFNIEILGEVEQLGKREEETIESDERFSFAIMCHSRCN